MSQRWTRQRDWSFWILLVLHLVPIWSFRYFPSQDGPAHLYNASLILGLETAAGGTAQHYFVFNSQPDPTWFGHLLLSGLLLLFSPLIAEKLFLTAYVFLMLFGARHALTRVDRSAGWLVVFVFPFVHSYFLHMGFYSFSLGVAVFWLVLGALIGHTGRWTIRAGLWFGALGLLLYLSHPFAFVASLPVLGLITLARVMERTRVGDSLWVALGSRALPVATALLPALLLLSVFVLPREVVEVRGRPVSQRLYDLVHAISTASFDRREIWLSAALVAVCAGLALHLLASRSNRPWIRRGDVFLVAAFAYAMLSLVAPETELVTPNAGQGGSLIHTRLNPLPMFMLLVWLAAQPIALRIRRLAQAAGVAIALMLLALHSSSYREMNSVIVEYTSGAEQFEQGSTLLALNLSRNVYGDPERALTTRAGNPLVDPLAHASHYLALDRQLVPFDNYEANIGYFPIVYRASRNPYVHVGRVEARMPDVSFGDYPSRTGGRVDYVQLLLDSKTDREHPAAKEIDRQLAAHYRLVHRSQPRGLIELYRRVEPEGRSETHR